MKIPEEIDFIIEGIKNGKYSLFLGAGVSKDSFDSSGQSLKDGNEFRKLLCDVTEMPSSTPLSSVAQLLSAEDKKKYITKPFSNTIPGETYKHLSNFIWKTIYTLNVDDCIEQHYSKTVDTKQSIISKNYKDSFETSDSMNNLQVIHLHGYARKPEQGYVFDLNEYINNIIEQNTWYKVFANSFSTNSFIVSGISFNEPDFIYYVNQRNQNCIRDDFYPSLLIEPFPNKLTRQQCEKHNLLLIESTFGEFLELIISRLKHVPSVYELLVGQNRTFSNTNLSKEQISLFFTQFIQIKRSELNKKEKKNLFFRGFEPSINDIILNYDINRNCTKKLYEKINKNLQNKSKSFILVNGKTYSGKTTSILRALYQLSENGIMVFQLKSITGFDIKNTVQCLDLLHKKTVIFIDNLSDYIEITNRFFSEVKNVLVVGAERGYREMHIQKVLNCTYDIFNCDKQDVSEIKELIGKYNNLGILADANAIHHLDSFVSEQLKQTIGETVCTLVNDFSPLQKKMEKLISVYDYNEKNILATAVLAYHCYRIGLNYEIFQRTISRGYNLFSYFKKDLPIKLAFTDGINNENDYIVPENKVLANCAFQYFLENDKVLLQNVYKQLLGELSYYVTRQTIKSRTAEARLVARLFDIDDIMKLLFDENIENVLEEVQEKWKWNSRYWEQRALAIINTDLDKSLLHAQHAVAIEKHPNTLTTLAKVQFRMMETDDTNRLVKFEIAAKSALQAMNLETRRNYHAIQPLIVLRNGLKLYLEHSDASSINKDIRYEIKGALSFYLEDRHFTRNEEEEMNNLIRCL